ncbi:hypothetical protein MAPG_05922 [Magnaporthiopsis poae ATCC 64411]|uniref:Tyrosinase copper-binding domain-containing protein n=1 Tax=Magnaporthiopsis poae (strain ATCC 64411 / 73-15) TaxID=644358 RepID=A0A0C4E0P1_MAGP6|nr:hypothetical protein MAPG_05922 [Magnaporthiopsis poae ATCC 64411]
MKVSSTTALALLASAVVAVPASRIITVPFDSVGDSRPAFEAARSEVTKVINTAREKKMAALNANKAAVKSKRRAVGTCDASNVAIRKEYGDLTKEERADYVRAVKCLMEKPAKTPRTIAPGARSRYDDFTVTHIQQTLKIHFTGNFMAWHRWFLYSFEKALRDECGYQGYQPYWDWAKYADAPQNSPIFNGDDTSLGGNGEFTQHQGPRVAIYPEVDGNKPGPMGGLGENPRPWTRDVGPAINVRFANYTTLRDMLRTPDIDAFRSLSEGPQNSLEIGPHAAGHSVISSDPGDDIYDSPNDPAFYVHHGMVDRMWAMWQQLDPTTRHSELGTGAYSHQTWANVPESNLTSMDEVIDLGYSGGKITIRELMDTTDGPFCYFYQ